MNKATVAQNSKTWFAVALFGSAEKLIKAQFLRILFENENTYRMYRSLVYFHT